MKKIINNIIPFKGFIAMCLWPLLFIRNDLAWAFNVQAERHENIHGEQQKEMLLVFFFLWYGIEWIIKLLYYNNSKTAYKNISFEREAYANENNANYLDDRKHFAWFKYI